MAKNKNKKHEDLKKEESNVTAKEEIKNLEPKENNEKNEKRENKVSEKQEKLVEENVGPENSNNKKEVQEDENKKIEKEVQKEKTVRIEKEIQKEKEKKDSKEQDNKKKDNEEKDSKKKDNEKKDNNKKDKVDLEKVKTKPEYVVDENKKKKKAWKIILIIICLLIVVSIFSTIFAFLNLTSTTIAKGVSVKGIDVSKLSVEEATNKVTEALNLELNVALNLNYEDYTVSFETNQIDYTYKITEAITKAYEVGRNKSLVENNYTLLKTAFWGTKVDVESSYTAEALDNIVNDVNSNIPGLVEEPSYYRENDQLYIEKGVDGIIVDTEKLKTEILADVENRDANEIQTNTASRNLTIPVLDKKADNIDIEKIYEEIYCEPKDAYYIEDPFQIFKEEEGVDFAITIDEAKEMISEDKEEYVIPLKLTEASKTINDIGTEAFPYLISSYPTRYDETNTNRTQNLKLATNKINGTVLMPGETFSFNQVVGKRTVEAGYKDAKIYENGKVVDGLAGGICQISSTLYNAVLLANLEIVERTNHSYTSSYVPAGRDATVVYGVKDFQFKNTRSYPIKIEGIISSGVVTFKIHGIKEETEYEVKIIPTTTSTIPYSTQTTVDYSLAPGQTVVDQSGHGGCKVTTYKQLWLNGTMVSNELLSNDTYNAMQTIIRVGPSAESTSTEE
jgi:vancomycin resistance protein YoaR